MIEIRENELRLDEECLKYVTDSEIEELRKITESISNRIGSGAFAAMEEY